MGGIRHTTGAGRRALVAHRHQPRRLAGRAVRGDRRAGRAGGAPPQRSGPGGRRRPLRGGGCAHGVEPGRRRGRPASCASRTGGVLPGVAPSNAYPTLDGVEVLIAANADTVFTRLCAAMGRPELAEDERYATHGARGLNAVELDEIISTWTATLAGAELLELLAHHGVPSGKVFTAADALAGPALRRPGAWCSASRRSAASTSRCRAWSPSSPARPAHVRSPGPGPRRRRPPASRCPRHPRHDAVHDGDPRMNRPNGDAYQPDPPVDRRGQAPSR